ncbi:MAG TPA: hypothetical protein VFG30_00595 [Polyangiales bacterium]|nr:hypothetical protein [Polyangiales bacterium]
MRTTIILVLAFASPATAWSNADPSPEPEAAQRTDPPDAVTGTGQIREALVWVTEGRLEVRTPAGWTRVALDTDWENAFESMQLVDLTGDAEPELRLETSWDHYPCAACDDGPWFTNTQIVVCRARGDGVQCASPIKTASYGDVPYEKSYSADLAISRGGIARLRIRESKGISRRQRAVIERPRRLFR